METPKESSMTNIRDEPLPSSHLDSLEAVARAAMKYAPGDWERDSIDAEDGNGKFKASAIFCDPDPLYPNQIWRQIVDTQSSDVVCIHTEYDEDGATSWDEPGRVITDHIATFDPPEALSLIEQVRSSTREVDRLREALRQTQAELATVDALMSESGWRNNSSGYLTDAALWLDRAMSTVRSALNGGQSRG